MHRLTYLLIGIASMTGLTASGSDQIPGAPQERPIAIENATVHTVGGDVLESATVLFVDGKITQIGTDIQLPDDCQIIDGNDKHVYPSMIESYADMGLVEINSISATVDSRETGDVNPNVQAVEAFNPDSEHIPVTRANGVLLSMTVPEGGLIAGRSGLMMLDGWTWEDMTLQSDVGMHVRWPGRSSDVEKLEAWLRDTKHYSAAREEPNSSQLRDLRLEAMRPVIDGKMPLIVSAFGLDEIETAVAFAQRHSLRLIVYGGYDAPLCASLLRKADVPVIVGSVYRTPRQRHRPYDDPYALPAKLQADGIRFCISAGGRFGASGVRNLPYNAATAAAYGLTEEQALRSITLSAAEILNVADRVGSIETGKDATLFIADGNILETETQVEQAFIQGRQVDLSSKHTQLYEKYRIKYQRSGE